MKRIVTYISSALLLMAGLCISCQKEQSSSEEKGASVNEVIVKATIGGADTKVSFTEEESTLKTAWENDDHIVGWDEEGNAIELKIASIDNGTAIFKTVEGSEAIPTSGKVYMIYAPGKNKSNISNRSLEYSLADQGSGKLPALMTATGEVEDGVLELTFANQLAILAVKNPIFPVTEATTITGLKLSGSNILTKATFSMDDEILQMESSEEGNITRACEFTTDAEGKTTETMVYFAVLPNSTTAEVTVSTTAPEGYQISFSDKSFETGNCYMLNEREINKQTFAITFADGITGGTVSTSPAGSVAWGTEVTVTATPSVGYELESIKWQAEGGSETDITLTTKFTMPAKAVTVTVTFKKKLSVFTVGSGTQVSFALGNLYAKKDGSGAWTWGFYDKQYKFHSESMKNILDSGGSRTAAAGDTEIDLFCWGYNSTNSTNPVNSEGISGNNKYDYKYNFSDGEDWGNITGLPSAPYSEGWRTLSETEWDHLLDKRVGISPVNGTVNARYLRCKVKDVTVQEGSKKDVYGLMIFPDLFTWPTTVTEPNKSYINNMSVQWNNLPKYTEDDFAALEEAGIVFLPAAGSRYNTTSVLSVGKYGIYWSSSAYGSDNAYIMLFNDNNVKATSSDSRNKGMSVRLVSVVPTQQL